jgi:dihydroneopterin aldolase
MKAEIWGLTLEIKMEAAPAGDYLTDSLCYLKVTRLIQDLPTSNINISQTKDLSRQNIALVTK